MHNFNLSHARDKCSHSDVSLDLQKYKIEIILYEEISHCLNIENRLFVKYISEFVSYS